MRPGLRHSWCQKSHGLREARHCPCKDSDTKHLRLCRRKHGILRGPRDQGDAGSHPSPPVKVEGPQKMELLQGPRPHLSRPRTPVQVTRVCHILPHPLSLMVSMTTRLCYCTGPASGGGTENFQFLSREQRAVRA